MRAMNELVDKFDGRLVILGFPCNQFGKQENCTNKEILNCLKYVRPGDGYEPKFPLFEKRDVNGEKADPIFKFLRDRLPIPCDESTSLMTDPKCIIWSPVTRSDISWNFEKFLIDPTGKPHKRFSRYSQTKGLEKDVKTLIDEFNVV
ncbi:hypothetical protein FSP39_006088 [Pinctada imbricata]|uniref:Glutathione peroxidase n=1 Tax=Pinctada imbricata TaxID=66713 RepID=A0AA88XDP6_PINIB|nr:hypothetical protein FSP39_006088 [Pinctada imbricata]